MSDAEVVVVGAGSAGSVIAGRLSDAGVTVILLEAGEDSSAITHGSIESHSFFDAIDAPGRTWASLVAARSRGGVELPYRRGRGLGGSSAVNAMIAMRSRPADHESWMRRGALDWGWEDVNPWFERTRLTLTKPSRGEIGPLSSAVLDAEPAARIASLSRRPLGSRVSASDAYLEPARARVNLDIVGDALVDRVEFDERRAVGVRLADGRYVSADQVVVCAGAIHSPAILLRSGLTRPGIGRNLSDHAAVAFTLQHPASPPVDARSLAVSATATWSSGEVADDLQLLPVDHLGPTAPGLSVLMIALMTAESRGTVTLRTADPLTDPMVDLNMLDSAGDLRRLRAGALRARELIDHPALADFVLVGDLDLSDDGLRAAVGDYFHAAGTCRIGAVDDPDAVVDQWGRVIGSTGLRVCDASIMPNVPSVNPHLLTVVMAERIAAQMLDSNSSIASRR